MKEKRKVDFDLSALSLKELVEVYQDITNFIQFLDESVIEEAGGKKEKIFWVFKKKNRNKKKITFYFSY